MLSKRRITVTHVDDAALCGGEGSFRHIVSVFNGADHALKTPVPSEAPPKPSISRLCVHALHGAVEVDVQLSPTDDYVLSANVNRAGVVACRMCPAPPSSGFCRDGAWKSASAHRLAFFSGRQRLAEVVLDASPADTIPTHDRPRADEGPQAWQASFQQWQHIYRRFPIQCFRAAEGVDVALFVTGPHVLCACTPYANKEQYLTLERSPLACLGAGRQGRGEATVLLRDGTVLLCGLRRATSQTNKSQSGNAHGSRRTSHAEDADDNSSSRESSLYRVRGSFAAAPPSASTRPSQPLAPLSADMSAEAVKAANDYLAHTVASADEVSELAVLSVRSLPPYTSTSTSASSSSSSSSSTPQQLLWAGQQTLWVLYEDGTIRAHWWPVQTASEAEANGQYPEQWGQGDVTVVFEGRLGQGTCDAAPTQVVLSADGRTPTLYYGYRCETDGDFHYGCHRLAHGVAAEASAQATGPARRSENASSPAPPPALPIYVHAASLEYRALFSETIYGIHFNAGRFHVLSQSRRGAGPLFMSGLPRGSPVQAAAEAGMNPATNVPLYQHILWDSEDQLAGHCQTCARLLTELGEGNVSGTPYGTTEQDVQLSLSKLHTIAHSVHALLLRSRHTEGGLATGSYPYQLLERVHAHEARLSAVQLLLRCCGSSVLETPLSEFLALSDMRATSQSAQRALQSLLEATTQSWTAAPAKGNAHQAQAPLAASLWPDRVVLCIDVLLRQLPPVAAALDESRLTVGALLTASTSMTAALALFVVYCSYSGLETMLATNGAHEDTATRSAGGEAGDVPASTKAGELVRLEELRSEFLARYNHPVSWGTWALLAYAADHRLSVPVQNSQQTTPSTGPAENEENAQPSAESSAASSSACTSPTPAHVIGTRLALAHQLGIPPYQDLLAPLVTGLMQAGAFDAAFHVVGTVLAVYPAASRELPAPLAQKLLFLAVQARSTAMVEQLYVAARDPGRRLGESNSETHWSARATQALAHASLMAGQREKAAAATTEPTELVRESCLEALQGFVPVASPEAATVEAVIQAHADTLPREYALLRFYTLIQRYADAVQTCERIAAASPAEAQRVQVVASYLSSLCPYENAAYMRRRTDGVYDSDGSRRPARATNEEMTVDRTGERAAVHTDDRYHDPFYTFTRVAPTLLESTDGDLRRQLEVTLRRLHPSAASTRATGSGLVVSGAVPVFITSSQVSHERNLRPSSILASVERVPTSERSNSSAGAPRPPARPAHHAENEESESTRAGRDGRDGRGGHTGAAPTQEAAYVSGFNRGYTCEATIQRSGKACGRERPCPYHDKK